DPFDGERAHMRGTLVVVAVCAPHGASPDSLQEHAAVQGRTDEALQIGRRYGIEVPHPDAPARKVYLRVPAHNQSFDPMEIPLPIHYRTQQLHKGLLALSHHAEVEAV